MKHNNLTEELLQKRLAEVFADPFPEIPAPAQSKPPITTDKVKDSSEKIENATVIEDPASVHSTTETKKDESPSTSSDAVPSSVIVEKEN